MYYTCKTHGKYDMPYCISSTLYDAAIAGPIRNGFTRAALYRPGFIKKYGVSAGFVFRESFSLIILGDKEYSIFDEYLKNSERNFMRIYADVAKKNEELFGAVHTIIDRDLDRKLLNDRLFIEKNRQAMKSICPQCAMSSID